MIVILEGRSSDDRCHGHANHTGYMAALHSDMSTATIVADHVDEVFDQNLLLVALEFLLACPGYHSPPSGFSPIPPFVVHVFLLAAVPPTDGCGLVPSLAEPGVPFFYFRSHVLSRPVPGDSPSPRSHKTAVRALPFHNPHNVFLL